MRDTEFKDPFVLQFAGLAELDRKRYVSALHYFSLTRDELLGQAKMPLEREVLQNIEIISSKINEAIEKIIAEIDEDPNVDLKIAADRLYLALGFVPHSKKVRKKFQEVLLSLERDSACFDSLRSEARFSFDFLVNSFSNSIGSNKELVMQKTLSLLGDKRLEKIAVLLDFPLKKERFKENLDDALIRLKFTPKNMKIVREVIVTLDI